MKRRLSGYFVAAALFVASLAALFVFTPLSGFLPLARHLLLGDETQLAQHEAQGAVSTEPRRRHRDTKNRTEKSPAPKPQPQAPDPDSTAPDPPAPKPQVPSSGNVNLQFFQALAGMGQPPALATRSVLVRRAFRAGNEEGEQVATSEFRLQTDAEGRVRLHLDPGWYGFRFVLDGFQPFELPEFEVRPGAAVPRTLHLVSLHVLTGQLISALTGAPIGGFEVRLQPRLGQPEKPLSAQTDALGHFRFVEVPGHRPYRLEFDGEGYEALAVDIEYPVPTPWHREIRLSPARRIIGQVISADKQPIAAAQCTLIEYQDNQVITQDLVRAHPNTRSNEYGRFEFARIKPGSYVLVVAHKQFLTYVSRQTVADAELSLSVTLQEGADISGLVSATDDAPVEGAEVRIRMKDQGPELLFFSASKTVLTGADGSFRITGVLPGRREYELTVVKPGFTSQTREQAAPFSNQRFRLARRSSVSGRIRVGRGQRAPSTYLVMLLSEDGGLLASQAFTYAGDRAAAEDGRLLPDAFHFTSLAPGRYRLAVKAEGFAEIHDAPFELPEGRDLERPALELSLGGVLRGAVTTLDGAAVYGVTVMLDPGDWATAGAFRTGGDVPRPSASGFLRSSTGPAEFEFRMVPFGKHRLLARHPRYADAWSDEIEVSAAAREAMVAISMGQGARIAGTTRGPFRRPLGDVVVELHGPRAYRDATTTDSQGGFSFFKVPPGEYRVLVNADRSKAARHLVEGLESQSVKVQDGQVLDLTIGERWNSGVLAGRLMGFESAPLVELFAVTDFGLITPVTRSDLEGRFRFDRLSWGRYALRVGRMERVIMISDTAAAARPLSFPRGVVTGRLFDAESGRALAGAIAWQPQRPDIPTLEERCLDVTRASVGTDAQGRFRITGIEPGNYRFAFRADGYAQHVERVEVLDGQTTELSGIDLGIEAGIALSVQDSGRLPIENALVQVFQGGEDVSFGQTRRSDRHGRVVLRGLTPGRYQIAVQSVGYLRAVKDTEAGGRGSGVGGQEPLVIELTARGTGGMKIRLQNPDARPLPYVRVFLHDSNGVLLNEWPGLFELSGGENIRDESNTAGEMFFPGIPSGTYLLRVQGSAGRTQELRANYRPEGPPLIITFQE